jgi:3-keto-disaccharide hydrolase
MRKLIAIISGCVVSLAALSSTLPLRAQTRGFLGRWNLTGTGTDANRVYWLEVTEQGGQLKGMFLNRTSSPLALASIKVDNDTLVFQLPPGRDNKPGAEFRAKLEGAKLVGTTTDRDRTINWVGVRPPKWPAADANAKHAYGTPVALFDGTSLDAFVPQSGDKIQNWAVADGIATNTPPSSNLLSKEKFKDFRIQAEYKLGPESNSGIYLRGRYELQVLDDFGKPVDTHGHMAIYGWTAPRVNASKPTGEWQTMEAVLVGNRLSVTLNGQKVHDNAEIQAITGGALDADEAAPGPIMIQGDHAKVWFRKIVITPIK